jgi:hypothetical protein
MFCHVGKAFSSALIRRNTNDEASKPCEVEEKANMTDLMHLFIRSAYIK